MTVTNLTYLSRQPPLYYIPSCLGVGAAPPMHGPWIAWSRMAGQLAASLSHDHQAHHDLKVQLVMMRPFLSLQPTRSQILKSARLSELGAQRDASKQCNFQKLSIEVTL